MVIFITRTAAQKNDGGLPPMEVMEIIRRCAYARAGLAGNPSDAYHGKVIAVIVKNFSAQATLYEWDRLEIVPSNDDESVFRSIDELTQDVRIHGYYGGMRLIKAAVFGFAEYCKQRGLMLHNRNFSIRYETSIPRNVGLAGSSAIITAALRVLSAFYQIDVPKAVFPSLVLAIEREQLGIPAGLQDRVAQHYEGCTMMDFSEKAMTTEDGYLRGEYEELPVSLLPPLYIAYSLDCGEPTEVFHNDLRFRYNNGEPAVLEAMQKFAALTVQFRRALLTDTLERRLKDLPPLMDANFDLRRSICRLPAEQVRMIETARSCGVCAKFAGSGGAVVGIYNDDATFARLQKAMRKINCETVKAVCS
jgi:glucuronokinase